MPEKDPPSAHADVRYEKSDARGGAIIMLGVLLAVLGLIVLASANWLFDFLKGSERRKYQPLPALAAKQRIQLPRDPNEIPEIPEPHLQISEPVDLAKLRKEEDARLTNYGWVDRKKDIVHIPIKEAMRLFLETNMDAKAKRGHAVKEGKK
jgi:hypothetical protein